MRENGQEDEIMDIRALVPSVGGGNNVPSRMDQQVKSSQQAAFAQSASVEVAVSRDVMTVEKRLESIQSMGVYLKSVSSKGLPKWAVMTALRAYGLNLEDPDFSKPIEKKEAPKEQIKQVAVEQKNVELEQVVRPQVLPDKIVAVEEPMPEPTKVVDA